MLGLRSTSLFAFWGLMVGAACGGTVTRDGPVRCETTPDCPTGLACASGRCINAQPDSDGQNVDDTPGYDPGMPAGGAVALPIAGTYGKAGSGAGGAAGGTGGVARAGAGGVAGGPSICDRKTYELPASEGYIDDFETNERFAGWYAFSDTTPPNMPKPERAAVGAVLTSYSGYFAATAIKSPKNMGYGAGFGFGLVDPLKGACVDVSQFDGISFWAKGRVPGSTLKFQIIAHESQPADAQPAGDCASTTSACAFRHPATVLRVTELWTHFIIRFVDLESPAFTWNDRRILGMSFITDGPSYITWIDEVTFFRGAAPLGPVRDDGAAGAAGVSGL